MTDTQPSHYSEWRRLANLRQGIIARLDRKVSRLEAENLALRTSLASATTRLALYDQREAA
ncbi:hypothetical protein ACIP9X_05650 [Arthrobacter sp. NPDC093125]|uniref:hypothetical protein n=1 Tax=Arthrobacter sp. NPDC093125 TaxID=3363944 RepID=UPI003824F4E7